MLGVTVRLMSDGELTRPEVLRDLESHSSLSHVGLCRRVLPSQWTVGSSVIVLR